MADKSKIDKLAMDIVNELFDLAEVPVEKREALNCKADGFVKKILRDNLPVCGRKLPSWVECYMAIERGEGTPLHRFIYDYDDLGSFVERLAGVLTIK